MNTNETLANLEAAEIVETAFNYLLEPNVTPNSEAEAIADGLSKVSALLCGSPAPQSVHPDVYRSLCEMIELVSDYENDAVPSEQAVIDRARAAMKAHGTATASANERTGIGFVPNKPRVLITVSGGVADFIKDDGVEVSIFDYDNYEEKEDDDKYLVPSEFRDMLPDDVDLDLIEFVD